MARHLTELIALVLLPLGGFIVVYALYTFVWRANAISQKKVRSRAWGAGRVEGVRRDKSGGGGWTACAGGCRGEQERKSFGDKFIQVHRGDKFTQVHTFSHLSHT